MTIIAVTRVLNEDDIIEPFIRHHAAMVDHHVLLDNGSIDHTLVILSQLRAEGLPISVYRSESVVFQETYFNTFLYNAASRDHDASWVLYLDADEFVDMRDSPADLRSVLESVPPAVAAVRLNMINYRDSSLDPAEPISPVSRIGYRAASLADVWKICVRGRLPGQVIVEPGNHGATIDGRPVLCADSAAVRLAHFTRRSAWQEIAKIIIGRLKVLATAGDAIANNRSAHYTPVFERMLHKPAELLLAEEYFTGRDVESGDFVHDPIRYEGGDLRYTHKPDYRMKAAQSVLSYAERLARHHAVLLQQNRGGGPAPEDMRIDRIL